jgi:hypothetical protein
VNVIRWLHVFIAISINSKISAIFCNFELYGLSSDRLKTSYFDNFIIMFNKAILRLENTESPDHFYLIRVPIGNKYFVGSGENYMEKAFRK